MRSARRVLPAMVAAAAVLALALDRAGRVSARMAAPALVCQSPSALADARKPPIRVEVDATRLAGGEPRDVAAVCGIEPDAAPRWRVLARSAGVRVNVTSDSDRIHAYAARIDDGFLVAVTNSGEAKAAVRLSFPASPGVFTFEKVTLDTRTADTALRFERLQGIALSTGARVEKPVWLSPHSGDIMRIVNRGTQVERSYRELRRAIADLSSSNAHQSRRLMSVLSECEDHVAAISMHAVSRDRLARHAHAALLRLALLQAFARNAGVVSASSMSSPNSIASRSETFEAALTELSAAVVGLIANVRIEVAADGSVREAIEVANNGDAGMSVVKVWPSGPVGGAISPNEPKLLGYLARGASARATFTVRLPKAASTSDLVAHVSYRFAGSPAHLRLQAP